MADVAPGWYPDPEDAHQQRYWDGTSWSQNLAPAGQSALASSVPSGSAVTKLKLEGADSGLLRVTAVLGLIVTVFAGIAMLTLESISGDTVAEAFYNQMGLLGMGLSVLLFVACWLLARTVKQNQQIIEILKANAQVVRETMRPCPRSRNSPGGCPAI